MAAATRLCSAVLAVLLSATGSASAQPRSHIDPQASTLGPFALQAMLEPLGVATVGGDTVLTNAVDVAASGQPATGTVYVFDRDPVTDHWAQVGTLTPNDGAAGFGRAFAVDGDSAIVGAQGAAYLFARAPLWHQVAKIAPLDDDPSFGGSVDIDGDTAVVGAVDVAYVFRRSGITWSEVAQLRLPPRPPDTPPSFPNFLSAKVSSNTAIVSRFERSAFNSGAAYIFERDAGGDDQWGLVKRLPDNDVSHVFPYAPEFDLDGDTITVSGGFPIIDPIFRGYLSVFERNLGGANAWGGAGLDAYRRGLNISASARISGNYIIVSDRSVGWELVRIHARHQGGYNAWGIVSDIWPLRPPGVFFDRNDTCCAVSGDTALVTWIWPGDPILNEGNAVHVLVSDVDGDGIRDGRDRCPRDPLNNTAGGCQRDASAYPNLNESIALGDVTTETQNGEFVITATFTNTSDSAILNPFFEVSDLSGGNELANADSDYGGVGATLSPDVGNGILSPSESTTVTFRIRLASFDPFSFFVNVRGTP